MGDRKSHAQATTADDRERLGFRWADRGRVVLAEQMEPVRRRVATRLVKAGLDTREVIARFRAEMQALAWMDHTSIAKVHDAGATDAGRPYFVSKYEVTRAVWTRVMGRNPSEFLGGPLSASARSKRRSR